MDCRLPVQHHMQQVVVVADMAAARTAGCRQRRHRMGLEHVVDMDCGQLHRMVADIAALGTRRGFAVVVRKGYAEALAVVVRKGCAEAAFAVPAERCRDFPDSRRHQRCLNWLLPSWDFSPQQVQVQAPVLSRARWRPCSTRRGPRQARLRTGRRGWTQVRQQRERKQLERQLGRGLGRVSRVQQRTRCRQERHRNSSRQPNHRR